MSNITNLSTDSWYSELSGLPCALYFYMINENIPNFEVMKDNDFLGNCPSIQSVQYVPFLNHNDFLNIHAIPYDVERFGSIEKERPNLANTPTVYRLYDLKNKIKELGTFETYKVNKDIGGNLHYKNESRLYNYPYQFAMLTDNLNSPMEIKYHLCKDDISKVKVINTISDRCGYGLFVEGYKGDIEGKLESMVSGDAHELPSSSSSYNQWYASNKNQVAQTTQAVMQNSFLTKQTSQRMLGTSMFGSLATTSLNPMSILGTGANMYGQIINNQQTQKRANLDVQQNIESKMAQSSDMMSTPNTMLSMGSDVYYGLEKGNKKVNLIRFGLHVEQLKKLGDYFAMFGYKQNKVLPVNTRNRYYYNYIKTVGINLSAEYIPRSHMEQLKSIYDNGVTIWHIDRPGVKVGDISKDNYEI